MSITLDNKITEAEFNSITSHEDLLEILKHKNIDSSQIVRTKFNFGHVVDTN